MKVRDLAQAHLYSCSADDSLATAARLMWQNDIGAIPVLAETGAPVAMITDRDICMSVLLTGRSIHEVPVWEAMSRHVAVAHEDQAIEEAEALMRQFQVHRLPVVDARGRLVGILSVSDIARVSRRPDMLIKTLQSITLPRTHAAPTVGVTA